MKRYCNQPYPLNCHRDFREVFETVIFQYGLKTMCGRPKIRVLSELCIMSLLLDGDVAEAGVARGGMLAIMAGMLPAKPVHGFDSWEGLPEATIEDHHPQSPYLKKGRHKYDIPVKVGELYPNIVFHKGWFKDTLPEVSDRTFCLVHIDCDLYQSAKECIEFFAPRMSEGSFMVFDDYWERTPGVIKAVDDFFGPIEDLKWWAGPGFIVKINKEQIAKRMKDAY